MSNFYGATDLIGGGSGALDKIDGAALVNGDGALVISSTGSLTYVLDATSGAAENSPLVIAPDTNPGTKRWILVNMAIGPHTIASHSDTDGTGPELDELIGGGGTTLHSHVGFIPSLELVDSYDTGDGNDAAIYDVRFEGQTFTASKNYTIAALELKLRSDTQDNEILTVSIYATTGSPALPTGSALCSGTINAQDLTVDVAGEWVKILLGTGAALTPGKYAICLTTTTSDNDDILWRVDITGSYSGGARIYDSGGDGWDDEVAAHDFMFRTFEAATALNTTHRGLTSGNPHNVTLAEIGSENYVDRGDPSAWDAGVEGLPIVLTADGTWRDLDLSSIVPSGASVVHLKIQMRNTAVGDYLHLRKNGNSNDINSSRHVIQISGVFWFSECLVKLDVNRKIEYWATNKSWSAPNGIYVIVRGWWA